MDMASAMIVILVAWLTGSAATAASAAVVERRVRLRNDRPGQG